MHIPSLETRVSADEWQLRVELADAFLGMYFLESTCQIQISAQAGGALVHVNANIMETMPAVINVVSKGQGASIAWPALLRKLERLDASYKS